MISMPIDKAKEMVLQRPIKAKTDAETGQSELIISDASSGRMASLKRR